MRAVRIRKCVDAECSIITFYDDEREERCPVCGIPCEVSK